MDILSLIHIISYWLLGFSFFIFSIFILKMNITLNLKISFSFVNILTIFCLYFDYKFHNIFIYFPFYFMILQIFMYRFYSYLYYYKELVYVLPIFIYIITGNIILPILFIKILIIILMLFDNNKFLKYNIVFIFITILNNLFRNDILDLLANFSSSIMLLFLTRGLIYEKKE